MTTQKVNFKNIKDVLSRDEMKQIVAGSGSSGTCAAYRPAGSSPTSSGSFSASSMNYNNGNRTYYGVSAAEAQWLVSGGGYWCCSSCGGASWH